MNAANIWNLDTGGGWYGFISIMDVDTKEVWQFGNNWSLGSLDLICSSLDIELYSLII